MESGTYSASEFRIRGMYSYKDVSTPRWAMQALLRCAGNSVMSIVEANLPINWERMSPKCWEAFPQLNEIEMSIRKLTMYPLSQHPNLLSTEKHNAYYVKK